MRRAAGKPKFGQWLEQGLGKTSLALNEFYDAYKRGEVDGCLVIAPYTFKKDWADAVQEWGINDIASGYWPEHDVPDVLSGMLYVVNYEAASRKGKMKDYLLWLMDQSRVFLVIDESKALGNPFVDTTRAVVELAKRATMVRELNGTPLTETVMDYWGQLRAIGAISGVAPAVFRARYAKTGGFMGKKVIGFREDTKEELAAILDAFTFRALKKDWRKDLPPKIYSTVSYEMTKRQVQHYQEMFEEFYTELEETGASVSASMVLTQMEKLRQISSCLAMVDGQAQWIEKPKDNPKLNALIDVFKGGSSKLMVIAVYKASVKMLRETFEALGARPALVAGGMTATEWTEAKKRFNEDRDCRVLIGQQTAVFRGHTLIGPPGDRASRMAFYEQTFSYYERAQVEDRIHRGAQDETCQYFDLIGSSAERKMIETVTGKKNQAALVDELVQLVRGRGW